MSSPRAKPSYTRADRALIALHQAASHGRRVKLLIDALGAHVPHGATLLDLGCGDLGIAAGLRRTRTLARCVGADVWPARTAAPEGCEYHEIALAGRLPWDTRAFDVVLLVDVLHHAEQPEALLCEALRVGARVLVKDHFEYGWPSRTLLKLLDWLGNRAYGVPVPGRYFTPARFDALVALSGACARIDVGLDLYGHWPLIRLLVPPRLHFVARLDPAPSTPAAESRPA